MGTFSESLFLLCETNLGIIRHVIEEQHPDMVVIDSIQTMYNEEVSSAPGSVSQVRESTNVLMQLANNDRIGEAGSCLTNGPPLRVSFGA